MPTKVHLVKAMVFPVAMYGCASWTIKKAEHQRIDAFDLWCWRRLLRVPWTARKSNHFLMEISPEHSLEGLMLNLKLQYFGHLMWRTDSLEKTLMLGKIEDRNRGGRQRMRWTCPPIQWTWVWASPGSWCWTGRPDVLQSTGSQRVLPQVVSWLLLPWWAIVRICPLELKEGHRGWNLPFKKQEKNKRLPFPGTHRALPPPKRSQPWDFRNTDVCFEEFTVSFTELYSYVLCAFLCVCAL